MHTDNGHGRVALLTALTLLLMIPGVSMAGILTGKVSNPNAVGVANVKVEFIETATGDPVLVVGNLTDALGNYGVSILDGEYDVQIVTPVASGGVASQQFLAVTITGTTILNVTCPFGRVLSGTMVDTLGAAVEGADINVINAVTGLLEFTPNDNTDITGFYEIMVVPGIYNLVFRPVVGTRLAATQIDEVAVVNDTTVNVAFPAGVFVTGRITDGIGQPVKDVDLDFDVVSTGNRFPTPGDNTDDNGDYIVTIPTDVYNITVEPLVEDQLVAQRIFSIPINKDTTIDWVVQDGWILSGVVTGPSGVVEDCDIDVVNVVTLEKLITPGDKTDAAGSYQVIVPSGTFDVQFQPPVATHLVSLVTSNVVVNADAIVNATLVTGVVLDGNVTSNTSAPVKDVDLDIFDAVTKATILVANDKTDVFGDYAIVLPAGNYDLEFEAPKSRRLLPERMLNVPVPADMTIPIVLDTGLSISGTVTGGGLPMDSVDIDAIKDATGNNTFQPADLSDVTGQYEIVVDFTPHTIVFYPLVTTLRVAKAFPGQNPGADLVLDAELSTGFLITGTVLDPGSVPFENVVLRAELGSLWAPSTDGITNLSGQYQTVLSGGTYTLKYAPPVGSGLDTLTIENVGITKDTTINVQFAAANQRPILTTIGPQAVLAEQHMALLVSASDADGPFPSLTISGLPANATFNDLGNGTGQFDFDPTLAQIGVHPVIFIASDGLLADSEFVNISVIDPNCDCPLQGDMNADTFPDSQDLNELIDVLFFGVPDPQDPLCPATRADLNNDGFSDSQDLNHMIEWIFFGSTPPINPCNP